MPMDTLVQALHWDQRLISLAVCLASLWHYNEDLNHVKKRALHYCSVKSLARKSQPLALERCHDGVKNVQSRY